MSWSVVLPVKRLERAKTRLDVPGVARADLALAMALDTALAALGCAGVDLVLAVSDDARAATALSDLGVEVVPDVPDTGLNAALRHGAQEAVRRAPGTGLVTLSSDLPAARPGELIEVLAESAGESIAFLADAAAEGTTALVIAPGVGFEPRFGPGSRDRHRAAGLVELTSEVPGLRRDVDTLPDLWIALALGCGPRTTALLEGVMTR